MRLALTVAAMLSATVISQIATAQVTSSETDSSSSSSSSMSPTGTSGVGNAAVKGTHPENAGPLAAGHNSFTMKQAMQHIRNTGYTDVTELSKDDSGVWHGKAMKNGQTVNVSVDFKGNVVTN